MRSARTIAVTGLMIGVGALAVPPAGAAPIRECGDLTHRLAYNITSRAVACTEARRVVRRWNNSAARRGGNGRVRGLYCRYRSTGYEAGDIRCAGGGGRVVRWQTGS